MAISKLPVAPIPGKKYLFDSNVWLFILYNVSLTKTEQQYVDFFENFKRVGSPPPKVVLPSIVLAEVVNRLSRDTYFKVFKEDHPHLFPAGENPRDYKEKYRPHEQYSIDLRMILDDIKSYHNYLEFVSDGYEGGTAKKILMPPPSTLDFNDALIVKIAKEHNLTVITHDGDFRDESIDILTLNGVLLTPLTQ